MVWYHECTGHPGIQGTEKLIRQHFWAKGLSKVVETIVQKCTTCKTSKKTAGWYGKIEERTYTNKDFIPFFKVRIDCIGPYIIPKMWYTNHRKDKEPIKFQAATISCNACVLMEAQEVTTFSGKAAANAFNQAWLCQYPQPHVVIFNQGNEFKKEFVTQLSNYGMEGKQIMVRNPQGNKKHEWLHAIVHNIVRQFDFPETVERGQGLQEVFASLKADIIYAMRSRWLHVAEYTPGQLAFNRNMVLNTPVSVNWEQYARKQKLQTKKQPRKKTSRASRRSLRQTTRFGSPMTTHVRQSTNNAKQDPSQL